MIESLGTRLVTCYTAKFNIDKKYSKFNLEIAQHELSCNVLVGVAYCTLLISEHIPSNGVWLKLAFN